jgi:hypothetical protein
MSFVFRRSIPLIALLLVVTLRGNAQTVYSPDVTRTFVSGFIGLNQNTNIGSFQMNCDCNFEGSFNLANLGAIVGADITYAFTPNWAVMLKAYYDNKHTTETQDRSLFTPVTTGQQVYIMNVDYRETADVSLAYATVGLFIRWQPRLERWYVFLGPTVGLPLASSVTHKQEIVTPDLAYKELLDTRREVSTGDFTGDLRLEGMVGFGYDYIVKPRWYVSPEIKVGYPLTKVTTTIRDGNQDITIDDWKTMSVQITVGLKYEAF